MAQQQVQAPAPAAAPSGRSPVLYVLAGVGVLVVAGLIYLFAGPSGKVNPQQQQIPQQQRQTVTPPVHTTPEAAPLMVSIDAQPWATINISGGDLKEPMHEITPAQVQLPPGRYTIAFENAGFPAFTQTVDVHAGSTSFSYAFQQVNADKLVDSAMK